MTFDNYTCTSAWLNLHLNINVILQDLERKLQSGQFFSNRMYLWKHRGFDPALRKYYWQHFSIFNDMKVSYLPHCKNE